MGKLPFFCFVRALGQGDWFARLVRFQLPPCDPWRHLFLCLPVLSPWRDMAPSPCLHPSPLGMPQKLGPRLGAPSVLADVSWHAAVLWGN